MPEPERTTPPRPAALRGALSPRNIGAIYVWILIIALFAILVPDEFPTWTTAKGILNQYSVTGLMALSLIVPLAASYFDLSIGFTMSLAGVLAAELLNQTSWSPVVVGLLVIAICVCVGLLNAFVVVGLGVDSFIGTLGTGAILAAITLGVSGNLTITGRIGEGFSDLASTEVAGITLPVFYLLLVMVALGYWLERTKMGRQLYAAGFDRGAARLSGLPVNRLGVIAFITSACIAGFAGMVLAARVSSGSPDAGTAYLIPAFSAAFLGATQLRRGRFNPWGTVIAVLLLGTGNVGLLLAGGPVWTPQLFEGTVLIAAVALTAFGGGALHERFVVLRARRNQTAQPEASSPGAGPPDRDRPQEQPT
jgi:ribose transport system permease protein